MDDEGAHMMRLKDGFGGQPEKLVDGGGWLLRGSIAAERPLKIMEDDGEHWALVAGEEVKCFSAMTKPWTECGGTSKVPLTLVQFGSSSYVEVGGKCYHWPKDQA